jgi:hypothetical protein
MEIGETHGLFVKHPFLVGSMGKEKPLLSWSGLRPDPTILVVSLP